MNSKAQDEGSVVVGEEFPTPFEVIEPPQLTSPLVFSSPHSGRCYLSSFVAASRLDLATLRRSEDAYVDELFSCVGAVGAPLLLAHVPRAYLDLNREPFELDPKLFIESLPNFANTRSLRVAAGLGTIPRVVSDAREIYPAKLTLKEALKRIELFYYPYHSVLRSLMARARERFGFAILIDCHSMPSTSTKDHNNIKSDRRRLDFVIGDRYGASADRRIVLGVEDRLKRHGYHIQRNRPYAGGFITEHFGQPDLGWHALQIEVSRALYMDEVKIEKSIRFPQIAKHIGELVMGLSYDVADREGFGVSQRAAAE
ncbi:MAG: N-formylglutamate amidohydrolase [Alphaproteobacteria bacterium]|nr:N-formylglutamate amidohydrolase [Alphaproteobacteria bacterium]